MPAQEDTWRNQQRLHVVFAASSILMLVSMVWMFADDHMREWKGVQRRFNRQDVEKTQEELAAAKAAIDQQKLDELHEQIRTGGETIQAHHAELTKLESEITTLSAREARLDQQFRFGRAELDALRSDYDIAIRDSLADSEVKRRERVAAEKDAAIQKTQLELQAVQAELKQKKDESARITEKRDQAEKELKELNKRLDQLEKTLKDKKPSLWTALRQMPILDAFASPVKIEQVWLPELTINYGGFGNVARFDRCGTCHKGIDRPGFEGEQFPQPFSAHPRLDLFVGATSPHAKQKFGCTICHDGQGSGTAFLTAWHTPNTEAEAQQWHEQYAWSKNHMWDYPQMPKRFLESNCLRCHQQVVDLESSTQYGDAAPKLLAGYHLIREFGCFGCHDIGGYKAGQQIGPDLRLESQTKEELAKALADPNQPPGTMRKVGPSLRHAADKTSTDWLFRWIKKPNAFRPDTRMPQFYGLSNNDDEASWKLAHAEIEGITQYLLAKSVPMEHAHGGPEGRTEEGRKLFGERGCLACHRHQAFPGGKASFGPDLSNLAAKLLPGEEGQAWLVHWLKDPNAHNPRTFMPNMLLDDPQAADLAAWLLSQPGKWEEEVSRPEVDEKSLDELVRLFLKKSMSASDAEKVLKEGVAAGSESAGGAEKELAAPISRQKKLVYLGAKTISRMGCFGCHDIPGFEATKPIGTSLADWGRKARVDPDKLAFEHIDEYLEKHEDAEKKAAADPSSDYAYYFTELKDHAGIGFIWQKLRNPRSYDYRKTEIKPWEDRLRMPRFTFAESAEENQRSIEAIITFVMGLTGEPAPAKYIYRPQGPKKALADGSRVITKFNCVGCHVFEAEKFTFKAKPEDYPAPVGSRGSDFPELVDQPPTVKGKPPAASEQATVSGIVVGTDDPDPRQASELYLDLWAPAWVGGQPWWTGDRLTLPTKDIVGRQPPMGGDFAELLVDLIVTAAPQTTRSQAWQFVPPPLVGEGKRVQTPWVYQFLLNPTLIRPMVRLRMPKFNLSPEEAQAVANYFAAHDGQDYPYQDVPETDPAYVAKKESERQVALGRGYLADAWKLLTDKQLCLQCHPVAGRKPAGKAEEQGPDLTRSPERFRPEWQLRWLANPRRIMPYTVMPQNFQSDQYKYQETFPVAPGHEKTGSLEQITALRDALANYHQIVEQQLAAEQSAPTKKAEGGDE